MADSREVILSNVTDVTRHGSPGTMVIFGSRAHGVLSGTKASDVFCAAAESEEGKVVVFTQDAYCTQLLKCVRDADAEVQDRVFYQNVLAWLTGDNKELSPESVLDVSKQPKVTLEELKQHKVVVWSGVGDKPASFIATVERYVRQGGGLVAGATPWGFLQLNPDLTLENLSMNQLIARFGFAFTPHVLSSQDRIPVSGNKAHLSNVLQLLESSGFSETALADSDDAFAKSLKHIPWLHAHGALDSLHRIHEAHRSAIHHVPNTEKPVQGTSGKALMAICHALHKTSAKGTLDKELPGLEEFPGKIKTGPKTESVVISVSAPVEDYYATGYYALPKQKISVEMLEGLQKQKPWKLMIGCHTDENEGLTQFRRWPTICTKFNADKQNFDISSIHGGSIYLVSPKSDEVLNLKIRLSGVVKAPYIDITNPDTVADWPNRRSAPGVWADLSGEFITFTLPSCNVRDIENPVPALEFWDNVMIAFHHLKGTDIRKGRRQWVVYDIQPSHGYMHAGYPIVAQLDHGISKKCHEIKDFVVDINHLRTKGSWGVYHELGHNMQDAAWTFTGVVEVTTNIFTLYAMETLSNCPAWLHSWISPEMDNIQKYLQNPSFDYWKQQAGIGLGVYMQIAHHFGWGAYKKIFRTYRDFAKEYIPTQEQDKIDQWIRNLSVAVGFNLVALHEFWGFPISEWVPEKLTSYPVFLPDDEMTKLAPDRYEQLRKKYPGAVKEPKLVPDNYTTALHRKPCITFSKT